MYPLTYVVKYDNTEMLRDDWTNQANFVAKRCAEGLWTVSRRSSDDLPHRSHHRCGRSKGRHSEAAEGPRLWDIRDCVVAYRHDAFRVVYAVQLADEVWVIHAFQKKSTQGIKTPQREIDLIKDRLKRLKEMLR